MTGVSQAQEMPSVQRRLKVSAGGKPTPARVPKLIWKMFRSGGEMTSTHNLARIPGIECQDSRQGRIAAFPFKGVAGLQVPVEAFGIPVSNFKSEVKMSQEAKVILKKSWAKDQEICFLQK